MDLRAEHITAGYGKRRVLDDLCLALPSGTFTGIVGPNGCGKSTLLKVFARLLNPWQGQVLLDGTAMGDLSTRQIARRLAVLPQQPTAPPELTVRELVISGRHPHLPRLGRLQRSDHQILAEALCECELEPIVDRSLGALSGGQRQRVWLGMALAQQPQVLLLDEPLTSLDINHQLEVMELLVRLNRERQLTIAIVLHDLNLAARFCDRLAIMHEGRLVQTGTPQHTFTSELVEQIFRVRTSIERDPLNGRPRCHFQTPIDRHSISLDEHQHSRLA